MSVCGPCTSLPAKAMVPALSSSKPAIISISVDLPHPEGPRNEMNSPSEISRDTGPKACTAEDPAPYVFVTPLSSMRPVICPVLSPETKMEGGTPAFHTIPPTLLVQELVGIEIFCLSFWIKIIIFFHQGYHIVPVAWNIQPNFFLLIGSRE